MIATIFRSCLYFFFLLAVPSSCQSSYIVMTPSQFDVITLGEDIAIVKERYGEPYEYRTVRPGIEEYVYIERVPRSAKQELFREYIFVVSNNRVIDKKIKETVAPSVQYVN